ncbi:hypothetical protein [Crocosphaera sp. Alani8]|uniref:hypothetical protein n=1 Tax=Crocosphaera sp. Alani8 TaxID=3038952 RepID=UPI00313D2779
MIPGFLELNIAKWLRAGGALAIFVIVYFYNPAFFAVQNVAREVSRRNAKDEFALLLERRLLAVGSQYKSGAYELDAPMEVTGVERSEIYRVHSKYVSLTSDLHNSLINGRYMQTYSVLVELKSLLNQIQSWGPSYQSLEEELFRQISPELRPNIAKNLPELQPSLTLFDQEHSNFAR